jgi:lipid-A-disaccharide synthase
MLVIFRFEAGLYHQAGVPVEFVGHPLIDLATPARTRAVLLPAVGLDGSRPVIALLPGSRANEVRRILARLLAAATLAAAEVPGVQVLIARAPSLDDALFEEPVREARDRGLRVAIVEGGADDVLSASDVVVTASGTATVQAALHARPMVIVYRLSPLTYTVGRSVVRVSTYGMVNLVAGRTIVPELIQDKFTPEAVAQETVSLLTDQTRADAMRRDLAEMRSRLGGPGASQRAAAAVHAVASHAKSGDFPD